MAGVISVGTMPPPGNWKLQGLPEERYMQPCSGDVMGSSAWIIHSTDEVEELNTRTLKRLRQRSRRRLGRAQRAGAVGFAAAWEEKFQEMMASSNDVPVLARSSHSNQIRTGRCFTEDAVEESFGQPSAVLSEQQHQDEEVMNGSERCNLLRAGQPDARALKRERQRERRRLGRCANRAAPTAAPTGHGCGHVTSTVSNMNDEGRSISIGPAEEAVPPAAALLPRWDRNNLSVEVVEAANEELYAPPLPQAEFGTTPEFEEFRAAYRQFRVGAGFGAKGEVSESPFCGECHTGPWENVSFWASLRESGSHESSPAA